MKMSEPLANISCQDLLRDDPESHSGWLHKKWLKRLTDRFKITSLVVPWRHYYVVLSKGNLYQYSSDMANRPSSCYSLYGYTKVTRASEVSHQQKPWAFKLCPVPGYPKREMHFSASSEKEEKRWMTEMKKHMMYGNGQGFNVSKKDTSGGSADSCSISAIEESVYDDPSDFKDGSSAPGEESSDSDYNEIEEEFDEPPTRPTRRPLPPLPGVNGSQTLPAKAPGQPRPALPKPSLTSPKSRPPALVPQRAPISPPALDPQRAPISPPDLGHQRSPMSPGSGVVSEMKKLFTDKPVIRPRPDIVPRSTRDEIAALPSPPPQPNRNKLRTLDVIQKEAFWTGENKEDANRIVSDFQEDGVYLIRAHDPDNMVLVVFAEGGPRKFRISKERSQFGISKDIQFPTLACLINHYHTNYLPSRQTRLLRGYNAL